MREIRRPPKKLAIESRFYHSSDIPMPFLPQISSTGSVFSSMRFSSVGAACAFLLSAAVPAGAAVLSVDDGTWEFPYTTFGDAGLNILAVNQFAGTGTITDVRIDWSSVEDGRAFMIGIWSDPNEDGSPDDAVLLQSMAGVTSNGVNLTQNAFFNTYDITDTAVVGSFFVGYSIAMPTDGSFASFDDTLSQEQSWLYFGGLESVGSAIHIAGEGSGNFLIRANLEAVPEPSAALALLGSLGFLTVRRRR